MKTKPWPSTTTRIRAALLLLLACALAGRSSNAAANEVEAGETAAFAGVTELTLDHAQRIALRRNPSLLAAGARVEQALASVAQAKAAYWPSVDLSGSASHVDLAESDYSASLLEDPNEYYSAGITATYSLFDGFARRLTATIAFHGRDAAEFGEADARRLTLLAVAAAYRNAQLAEANLRIARADQSFFARQLKDAEARLRAGTGAMSDKLSFEVRVNSAKTAVLQYELERRTARIALAAVLACDEIPATVSIAELEPETPGELVAPEEASLLDLAKESRPDVQRVAEIVNQAHASVGLARAAHLPTVSLAGAYELERTGDMTFEDDDAGYTVGVALSFNVFDGGLTRARVREARAAEDEARLALREASINAHSEVRKRHAALLSAQQQVLLQRSNSKLVERTRDLVEKEYAKGQASLVRLTEAQRDMTTAQGRLALALARMRLAWSELRAATGQAPLQSAKHSQETTP